MVHKTPQVDKEASGAIAAMLKSDYWKADYWAHILQRTLLRARRAENELARIRREDADLIMKYLRGRK